MATMICPVCKKQIPAESDFCSGCGTRIIKQAYIYNQPEPNTERSGCGFAIVGFLLSIMAFGFYASIPVLTVVLSILGIIFNAIGMPKRRRLYGLAIAGFVLSLLALLTSPLAFVYSCITNI